jgi:prepilin-type N-terminal cleavage/methylation domain-containing protein
MKNRPFGSRSGFTLIELLIVIAIIGFLMAAILVAVDPVKRVRQSRNAQRWSEVNAVLNAILKKQVDERDDYDGETSAEIVTSEDYVQVIVRDDTGIICNQWANRPGCDKDMDISGANKACVANLDDGIVPAYIAELPFDPLGEGLTDCGSGSGCLIEGGLGIGDFNTGYYIQRTANGRIEIGACYAELDEEIRVKR